MQGLTPTTTLSLPHGTAPNSRPGEADLTGRRVACTLPWAQPSEQAAGQRRPR